MVLITSATNGIGEEASRLFGENGAFVVAIDVQDELGNQVATSIGLERVSYRHCNVRDEKQVEEIVNYKIWQPRCLVQQCRNPRPFNWHPRAQHQWRL